MKASDNLAGMIYINIYPIATTASGATRSMQHFTTFLLYKNVGFLLDFIGEPSLSNFMCRSMKGFHLVMSYMNV